MNDSNNLNDNTNDKDKLNNENIINNTDDEEQLLFYMVLVIELNQLGDKNEPFIAYRLPNLWEADPFSNSVASFCFPDTTPFPTNEMQSERFSFVLTEDDGDRRFGYCLRKLAQGSGPRMPICFAVLTYIPCEPLYNKILDRIAYHYESSSSKILTHFLESVVQNDFPKPGEKFSVTITDNYLPNGKDVWTLELPETGLSLSQIPVDKVLISLSPLNILRIFASILIERRIIFCSRNLSSLSNIAQVMMALIYPFVWQHIFIPILPLSLLSYCCAPMPFVVGVLYTHIEQVIQLPMDEVLIVMLDEDRFIRTPKDDIDSDLNLIPSKDQNELLKHLKNARRLIKRSTKRSKIKGIQISRQITSSEITNSIEEIQQIFLQFFVTLMTPAYKLHFSKGDTYSHEIFLKRSPPEYSDLLELFSCSQLYHQFIRQNLYSDANKNSPFERYIRQNLRRTDMIINSESRHRMDYPVNCITSSDPLSSQKRQKRIAITHNSQQKPRPKLQYAASSTSELFRMRNKELPSLPALPALPSSKTSSKSTRKRRSNTTTSDKPNIRNITLSTEIPIKSDNSFASWGTSSYIEPPTESAPLPPITPSITTPIETKSPNSSKKRRRKSKMPKINTDSPPPSLPSRDLSSPQPVREDWTATLNKRTQKRKRYTATPSMP